MPKGGVRKGAGRPKGALSKRHQVTAAQIGHDGYPPIEYMLALMRDEKAEATRRDAMAIQAANVSASKARRGCDVQRQWHGPTGDINITQIFAVPRGARIEKDGTAITIDGSPVELATVSPFEGTPPLGLTDQTEQPAPMPEPPPVIELDTSNVTVLRRRDDDDDPAGAA